MNYDKLELFFSKEKLKTYDSITDNKEEIEKLFIKNLLLSSYFYQLIQIVELSTRNIFNQSLNRKYGDWLNNNYILSGNNGLDTKLMVDIKEAKCKKINSNNDDIISNLTFGFWTNLLSNNNKDKIWQPALRKIFINYDRKYIQDIFLDIKNMRNRIAHHETIINKNINKLENEIFFILNIYSVDLVEWVKKEIKYPKSLTVK